MMPARSAPAAVNAAIADAVAATYADPAAFVRLAYPWGRGALAGYSGPDEWQDRFLRDLGEQVRARRFDGRSPVAPIRMAVASGHGIGKTTLVAWLVGWILSTRPGAIGTITANTLQQLGAKTWPAVERWNSLSLTGHWFTVLGQRIYRTGHTADWFCSAATCREENSEAFAGQHAAGSTSFYIFDEASAVPEKIWEVAEGGLTDGEPMFFAFGNPTRTQGKFHRVTFGSERERWNSRSIDSRAASLTNKAQIAEWIHDYGEDSDFVRVRIKGLPPRASDSQYIDSERVADAQRRNPLPLADDPLVCGLDVARGGDDSCVFRFRRGVDARSIPPIRIPGEKARDSMLVVTKATDVLTRRWNGHQVAMLFVDETGIGGPIVDRLVQLGHRNVTGVHFGGASPDPKYANMRAWMWSQMRDWLPRGSIDSDQRLEVDLTGPGYRHDKSDRLVLESKEDMKKRGLASPDDADALGLTFARAVAPDRRRHTAPAHVGPWS